MFYTVRDDGKLPQTICPGCNIQLAATVQFFDLLVVGQRKLRDLWKYQVEQQRRAERLRNKESAEFAAEVEGVEVDSTAACNEDEQYEQQIIIKIMPDGSVYAAEHEISLQMEGLTKPRRKRGRPPKAQTEAESLTKENVEVVSQGEEDKQEEELEEVDGDGRRRRKRKVPKRFMEAVQGKELERIFKEEGVIEEDDDDFEMLDDSEEPLNASIQDGQKEVIGRYETQEGKNLGEVTANRGRARSKSKLRRRKNKFTCQLCGRNFLQRSKYLIHKNFHKSIKYECTQCKTLFDSKENLALHQKTAQHSSNPAEENIEVQESFEKLETQSSEQDYSTTTMKEDSSAAIYMCERCDKHFESKQEYELHMKLVHELQRFTCNVCNKAFTNQSNLTMHMATHEQTKSNKGFPCDICGKVLNHPSSVVYHKEAEHNNGRRFVCNKCNRSFKHKQLLQRHQLVHSDDRPYVCKSCSASFKTKANLINHQSTHTGEKRYYCERCNQQFAHKTSLTLHQRWHDGEKPYTCQVCHKSFSQNGNLQEHMRIHTGEKPYSCEFARESLRRPRSLSCT
ncbi:zinc finger protein 567-like isoform X2 [Nylanderia fulva]|uniref:zinc finger protein 567-like isoform X2 n=1 Tax=Nylanderia fulva TaxID=613905 RepID=UPI0010FAD80F|nr:zinc finger protein 567-like isoform X2 [Nylanderia fulva]